MQSEHLGQDQRVESRRLSWLTLLLAAAVFSAAFVAGSYSIAEAGTACSSYGYYSQNGVSYKNKSCIVTAHSVNHNAYSTTLAYVTSGTAEKGWVGGLPRRYNDTGTTLLCTSYWRYSSSEMTSSSSPLNPAGCSINNHSAYASDGQTRAWNGSSYYTYGAFTSPAQNS